MSEQVSACFRYGIWGDWDDPYLTLDPAYEAAQLKVFAKMVLNGHIYRGRKPVHWSPSSQTALAESELEYPEGHVSPSIYVALPIEQIGNGHSPGRSCSQTGRATAGSVSFPFSRELVWPENIIACFLSRHCLTDK